MSRQFPAAHSPKQSRTFRRAFDDGFPFPPFSENHSDMLRIHVYKPTTDHDVRPPSVHSGLQPLHFKPVNPLGALSEPSLRRNMQILWPLQSCQWCFRVMSDGRRMFNWQQTLSHRSEKNTRCGQKAEKNEADSRLSVTGTRRPQRCRSQRSGAH